MTKLEKENAELKKQLEMSEQAASSNPDLFIENCNLKAKIAKLKHEIDELKELHESDKKATALLMQKWEEERNELKAHCKAVDEVNAKMKCCWNCKKERNKPEPLAVHVSCAKCKNHSEWEIAE